MRHIDVYRALSLDSEHMVVERRAREQGFQIVSMQGPKSIIPTGHRALHIYREGGFMHYGIETESEIVTEHYTTELLRGMTRVELESV